MREWLAVSTNTCLFGTFFLLSFRDQMMIRFERSRDFASRISGSSFLCRISGNSVRLQFQELPGIFVNTCMGPL